MLSTLVEGERVEGVHVEGIDGSEHEAVVGILPAEVTLEGRVKMEGAACGHAVHIPVERQDDGHAALDGGVILVPHGAVVDHHGGRVAHALEEEVLIGGLVGGHSDRLGLGEMQRTAHLDGVGARGHILEHVDAVAQGVGHTALHLVAVAIEQACSGIVDGHQVVVAIDEERLCTLLQALEAVVTHVARDHTQAVTVQTVEIFVGTQRDVPTLHPTVVETEQAVGLGNVVVERAFAQVGHRIVAAQHAIALGAPLGTERPVAPNLVIIGPHRVLAGIQIGFQVGSQHIGVGNLGRTRVATVEHHREIAAGTGARGIAVHRVEHVGAALVAQGDDGRERQVVGGGVGHTRDAGLVALLLQNVAQGKTLAQVGLRLPRAGAVALGEGVDDHVAVVTVIAAMARVDVHVGLLLSDGDIHGQNRQQGRHQ